MAKICFTTFCSDNHYQYFIPIFVYSVKIAYPNAGVKVFLKGKLKDNIRDVLKEIEYPDWEVKENFFTHYPNMRSMCNSLRFLIPQEEYEGYDYIFIRDVDFIVFAHKFSHLDFFAKKMGNDPIYAVRGPYRNPRRPEITSNGWTGDFSRIAGGTVVFKNPDWYNKTNSVTKEYRHNLKHGIHDEYDKHIPASYREYDEVMLYRICKKCKIKTPKIKNRDIHGSGISSLYRDIHLGDFDKKWKLKRLRRVLKKENIDNFLRLEQDPLWQKIKEAVWRNEKIRKPLKRLLKHTTVR